MRLLLITTIPGTLEAFLLPYGRHFRSRGWQVDAMAEGVTSSEQCRETFDHLWEVKWSRNPVSPANLLRAPRQVRQVVAAGKYDLVHVHTPVAAFVTRLALRRRDARPKVIYTAHGFHFYQGGPLLRNQVFLALEKLAGHWTDHLVVINEEDLLAAQRHHLLPADRIHYMPGIGVDLKSYSATSTPTARVRDLRKSLGLSSHEVLFTMVAEFIPRKRHQDVLQAMARLARSDIHVALAGDGPLRSAMEGLAEMLKIRSRVHFLGYRRDIPVLIRASRALLLPSFQEGLPRSIMEAFCLETPCIGSDIRGTRDLIGSDCGLLFPPGSVQDLARALEWMADHPSEVAGMGAKARQRVQNYAQEHLLRLHEDLYEAALATAPAEQQLKAGRGLS